MVEFKKGLTVSILAYVDNRGGVYHVDGPISLTPEGDPDFAVVPDASGSGGTVYVKDEQESLQPCSHYRGAFSGLMSEVHDTETWNTTRSLGYRPFMASMYLRLCVLDGAVGPRWLAAPPVDTAQRELAEPVNLFQVFSRLPLPDAIDATLYRIGGKESPSGVERFAEHLFQDVDSARLRSIATKRSVSVVRIERMDGLYLNYGRTGLNRDDDLFLIAVEARINRLYRVACALGFGLAPITSSPSEEVCSLLDQRAFRGVTGYVKRMHARSTAPNEWGSPGAIACTPGGEWDVRTRFALMCESLNVVVRLDYTYHCNASTGDFRVGFTAPDFQSMPEVIYDQFAQTWRRLDETERRRVAEEYACRITLVLVAAAFASGIGITSCVIDRVDPREAAPNVVARFERTEFIADVVPVAERLDGRTLLDGAATRLVEKHITYGDPWPVNPPEVMLEPREDTRMLPEVLQDLLLADSASDLEVMERPGDPYMERLLDLRNALDVDPGAAEQGFIQITEELGAACAATELMSDTPLRSEFCESYLGRVILPILIDDQSVRINRVPDALFFAQYELTNMYFKRGEYERALPEARKLLDMASTSMQAHFMLVNVLARLERFQEVIDVVKHGLRVAFDRESIAYLFYRVAFAYWSVGSLDAALACYSLIPEGEQASRLAQSEVAALMAEMGRSTMPDISEVRGVLRREGVTMPPSTELIDQAADAAVLLADNGFFFLANRCVRGLWHIVGNDELGVVSASLG